MLPQQNMIHQHQSHVKRECTRCFRMVGNSCATGGILVGNSAISLELNLISVAFMLTAIFYQTSYAGAVVMTMDMFRWSLSQSSPSPNHSISRFVTRRGMCSGAETAYHYGAPRFLVGSCCSVFSFLYSIL